MGGGDEVGVLGAPGTSWGREGEAVCSNFSFLSPLSPTSRAGLSLWDLLGFFAELSGGDEEDGGYMMVSDWIWMDCDPKEKSVFCFTILRLSTLWSFFGPILSNSRWKLSWNPGGAGRT